MRIIIWARPLYSRYNVHTSMCASTGCTGRKSGFRPVVFYYMKEGLSERLEKLLCDGEHSSCWNL